MPKYLKGNNKGQGERKKPWQATVRYENMNMFLGYFTTREEAVQAEDKFKAGEDDPDTILTTCYCQSTWVWIPRPWIKKFTKSCGAKGCVHPLMKKAG